jgi:hypothetical protein
MKKVEPKKKRGRPATGRDPLVSVRLSTGLIEQVRAFTARYELSAEWCDVLKVEAGELSPSAALRALIAIGLRSRAKRLTDPVTHRSYDLKPPAERRAAERVRRSGGSYTEAESLQAMQAKTAIAAERAASAVSVMARQPESLQGEV